MRIYLAGPHFADEYRKQAKTLLHGHFVIDPMRRDYRGQEDENFTEIVHGDLADIDHSDAVLADFTQHSTGTAMECFYARFTGVPVHAFTRLLISPWLRYVAQSVSSTLEEAIARVVA